MLRHDDTFDDLLMAWAATMFYCLGGVFLIVAVGSQVWGVLYVVAAAFFMGGLFHFIKVSSDGRVRNRRCETSGKRT